MQKAAFFDVDNTLVDGFLLIDFINHLVGKGLFEREQLDYINNLARLVGSGQMGYREGAPLCIEAYGKGLKGQRCSDVADSIGELLTMIKLLPGAKELVAFMNEVGYYTSAISGSPKSVIDMLELGFDDVFATVEYSENGVFTGAVEQVTRDKTGVIDRISAERQICMTESYGFGDSENDTNLLNRVCYPVAINPRPKLREMAESNGWHIFDTPQGALDYLSEKL